MVGQKGEHHDVTRRAFCAYIAKRLGKAQREVDSGNPSILHLLRTFETCKEKSKVRIYKNKELKKISVENRLSFIEVF